MSIVSRRVGRGGGASPRSAAKISPNSHGLPIAPRPTITASQPVAASRSVASCALTISPLPSTGTATAAFTAAMQPGSMGGVYIWARVRACTTMAAAPAASHCFATSTQVTVSSSQPLRIFTVTGKLTAAVTAATILPHSAGSFISALPAPVAVILGAGQPMLMSIKSGCQCSTRFAPSAIVSGSLPNS